MDAETDLKYLRQTIEMARECASRGIHPFAALLVDAEGQVLMQQVNAFLPDHDMTGHAERVLMTRACTTYEPEFLAQCTMYTSAEPCAMCAGAVYWAGVGRVVYSLSEHRLKGMIGPHPENLTMDLPCRKIFAAGQREVEVIGPLIEDEGAVVHEQFWNNP